MGQQVFEDFIIMKSKDLCVGSPRVCVGAILGEDHYSPLRQSHKTAWAQVVQSNCHHNTNSVLTTASGLNAPRDNDSARSEAAPIHKNVLLTWSNRI
jgi:hypothetical protein